MNPDQKSFFKEQLRLWNILHNGRKMPWKGEKNPYRLWLSEIILQQTRVEQGWKYYNAFITKYATVNDLARAPETEVFKLWEGLGYYSRCRNMIHTAKYISENLNGTFPGRYEEILSLKGVGPYTAAAIASFAFNLPHAVVDGNVFRVLSRFFGIATDTGSSEGKKYFSALAHELLDKKSPSLYNQAIMDFGATICKPVPLCEVCPLKTYCFAFQKNEISNYPFKQKKTGKKKRWFNYIIAACNDGLYIQKRVAKDVWQDLYQFILIDSGKEMNERELYATAAFQPIKKKLVRVLDVSKYYKQQLTHQTIYGKFYYVDVKDLELDSYQLMKKEQIISLPFPKLITGYLKDSRILL